jgi:hypothetical protein
MTPIGGQNTRAQLSGFNVSVKEWKAGASLSGEADYTNSESAQDANGVAFANRKPVVKDMTITFTAVYDLDNLPSASPPNLVTGATISGKFFTSKTSNKFYNFPVLVVCEDAVQMQIKDVLWVSCTVKPDGSWTYPS